MKASAVVVNYKSAALALECVASLWADGVDEVVVVDSASGEDLSDLREAATTCVELPTNRGYGAGANAGVLHTTGDVVFISNADLEVAPGTVAALTGVLQRDPKVGAVGPRIDRPDGTRYPSARSFPSLVDAVGHGFVGLWTKDNEWSRRYLRTDLEEAGPVDWVGGPFFAARREAWDAVRGFDESYFMFMEDVDLFQRIGLAGWTVVYEPAGRVVHIEGASRASAPYRMIVAHHLSLLRYGWRTASPRRKAVMPLIAVGLAGRAVVMSGRMVIQRARTRDRRTVQ